ncbi:HAD family hydrolase [Pseudoalteromonas xiamenensis]|uniref:HAD family hydrolase n=1 Tax=Pseudoalteromonas xiamenensis TaxID=882626 RepID=UPI0035E9445A
MKNLTPLFIFDLDGTIVDSANEVMVCVNMMRKERGLAPISKSLIVNKIGHGAKAIIENVFIDNEEKIEELVEEFRTYYTNLTTPKTSLFEGATSTLQVLKNRNCKIALFTNKPKNLCVNVLDDLKLHSFFDYIISNDGRFDNKPSPAAISYLVELFKVDKRLCFMVGDTTLDQLSARHAGVNFILFKPGYDDGVRLSLNEMAIQKFDELIRYSRPLSQGGIVNE